MLQSHNCDLLVGGICMPSAGHGVCQNDTCAGGECVPSWSAGKSHCIVNACCIV